MTNLEAIEAAVSHLSPPELEEFRAWFEAHMAASWDERMARDIDAGKLDELAQAALSAHAAGRTREL